MVHTWGSAPDPHLCFLEYAHACTIPPISGFYDRYPGLKTLSCSPSILNSKIEEAHDYSVLKKRSWNQGSLNACMLVGALWSRSVVCWAKSCKVKRSRGDSLQQIWRAWKGLWKTSQKGILWREDWAEKLIAFSAKKRRGVKRCRESIRKLTMAVDNIIERYAEGRKEGELMASNLHEKQTRRVPLLLFKSCLSLEMLQHYANFSSARIWFWCSMG